MKGEECCEIRVGCDVGMKTRVDVGATSLFKVTFYKL